MQYAELSYFGEQPCQHVADWQEFNRLRRIRESARGLAVYATRHVFGKGKHHG